jgi:hypothetical protein
MPQLPKLPTDMVRYAAGVAGALLVLGLGKWLAARGKHPPKPRRLRGRRAHAGFIQQCFLVAVDGSESATRAVRNPGAAQALP